MVRLLIEHGANVKYYGRRAILLALESGHEAIAELLVENGSRVLGDDGPSQSPLNGAIQFRNLKAVGFYLKKRADVNATYKSGISPPLFTAIAVGDAQIVALLIAHGANVNSQNRGRNTPLHWACREGDEKIVSLLLQHGADVNAKSSIGETPLILALKGRHEGIAKMILKRDVDVAAKDGFNQTALHWAVKNDYKELTEELIMRGAKN